MTECIKDGAALTSVHSREEEDFLNDLSGGNSYWLGGYPVGTTWVWADFTDFDYTHDYNLRPEYDYCIYQSQGYYGSGWLDNSCTGNSFYYICKNMQK